MKLNETLDVNLLNDHIENKLVFVNHDPNSDLRIYKYTKTTPIFQAWDDVTMQTRGLIVDSEDNIIARGFNKFFNLGEHDKDTVDFDSEGTIMPKVDGSLGIAYFYNGDWNVSTAGSFASDQAIHATKLFRDRYADTPVVDGLTLLFEIVYPDNKIVTDYGDLDDLILLGGTKIDGSWVSPDSIDFSGRKVSLDRGTLQDVLDTQDPNDGSEGFIFRSDDGMIYKIKFPSYLKLHRAKFSLSPRKVWESIVDNNFDDYLLILPDEFHNDALGYRDNILRDFSEVLAKVESAGSKIPDGNRKDKAIWINNNVDSDIRSLVLSKFLSGNDITGAILKKIKP